MRRRSFFQRAARYSAFGCFLFLLAIAVSELREYLGPAIDAAKPAWPEPDIFQRTLIVVITSIVGGVIAAFWPEPPGKGEDS
jgi:hypothetical protein